MRVDRRALTALTLALALTPAAGAHAATQTYVALFYDEDMQGAAQSLLFTPADSSITLQRSGRTGRGTDAAEFDVQRDSNEFWDLDFYSPDVGVPLRPGVYDQTGPTGSAPRARLHVGGSHGGCEPDAGRFEIKDVAPDAAGNIGRLWAIFEYHCGDENPWARFGEIKFNEPAAETGIEAQPSVMRWPAAEFGYKRANVVVTLRAATASRITGVRIDGSEAGDYAVHDDGCSGVSLGAGATCRIGL